MKNQWPIWIFVICVIVVVLFAFNYQGKNSDTVPLSEIFPSSSKPKPASHVEYEFMGKNGAGKTASTAQTTPSAAPASPAAPSAPAAVAMQSPSPAPAPVPEARATPSPRPAATRTSVKSAKVRVRRYTIQVSSYKNRSRAEKALAEIKKAGYAADIVSKNLGSKGIWYRIYIGHFETKRSADAYLEKVRPHYKHCFVISER